MNIESIKDPKLRARVEDALRAADGLRSDLKADGVSGHHQSARKPPRRIRQSQKPLLNKLEQEYWDTFLQGQRDTIAQSVRLKLANGLWFKVDFFVWGVACHGIEVKGPFAHRGGFENLKMAAHQVPVDKVDTGVETGRAMAGANNSTMTDIQQFLTATVDARKVFMKDRPKPKGFRFGCLDEMILSLGIPFKPSKLPKDIPLGEPKNCYMNAAILALEQPDRFTYVEGYAAGVIPLMHAWCCINGTDRAIDPTWKDGREYFGVAINHNYLRKSLLRNKFYGIMDNWMAQYPILKDNPKSFLA